MKIMNSNSKLYVLYNKSLLSLVYRKIRRKLNRTDEKLQALKEQMNVDRLLPKMQASRDFTKAKKIKVRLVCSSSTTWATVGSLYEAFITDSRYDVIVIVLDSRNESLNYMVSQMEKRNVRYVIGNEGADDYDIKKDKPDIFVVTNPWREGNIKYVRESCTLVAVASFTLIDYSGFVQGNFWSYVSDKFSRYDPDVFYFDSLLYDQITSETQDPRIKRAGSIKYDDIFNVTQGNYDTTKWNNLRGKKVILYATTHGIINYKMSDMVSFDIYWPTILDYMMHHEDMGLIFRPHPNMINELIDLGIWSSADYIRFRRAIQKVPNIVYDESASYNDAYGVCDAILTDAFCGISASALPLMKPIALLYRNQNIEPLNMVLEEALYSVKNVDNLIEFLDMVEKEEDPKYTIRKKACSSCVMHFDGRNGERMKMLLEKMYFSKIGREDSQ